MSSLVRGPKKTGLFLHIPKTAGVWFYQVVTDLLGKSDNEIEWVPSACGNPYHPMLGDVLASYEVSFSVIRHPITWYESWWKFKAGSGWQRESARDGWWCVEGTERCSSNDFDTFVRLMLRWEPAFVTRMYEWYVGPKSRLLVDMLGKYESLYSDTSAFLRELGWDHVDADYLRKTARKNVSLAKEGRPVWNPALRQRIAESEMGAINRFYEGRDENGRLI